MFTERTSESRLRDFVQLVASLNLAGEPDNSGEPFQPTDEDNADTLKNLIHTARELLAALT